MKKLLILFYLNLAFSGALNAVEHPSGQIIDFNQFQCMPGALVADSDTWRLGYAAFNCAPELALYFAFLKTTYNIKTAVETGTHHGSTAACFSLLFDKVHTIEISKDIFKKIKPRLEQCPNVQCHLGSSEVILKDLLPELAGEPVLFYLDAHWNNHWPLLEELEEISMTHHDNCIIVIDDFKVPGRKDISYDKYGIHECSYEYIKDQLDKVFTEYDYYYLIPHSKSSKAKFVAKPKTWVQR